MWVTIHFGRGCERRTLWGSDSERFEVGGLCVIQVGLYGSPQQTYSISILLTVLFSMITVYLGYPKANVFL